MMGWPRTRSDTSFSSIVALTRGWKPFIGMQRERHQMGGRSLNFLTPKRSLHQREQWRDSENALMTKRYPCNLTVVIVPSRIQLHR